MPAVNLITAVPHFVSNEEQKALLGSTPASFSDIPPILTHREDNVSIALDPPLEGYTTEDSAQGTLYVLTSVLVFMSTTGRGFQIEYPAITLHAISREPSPSIYCQLDDGVGDAAAAAVVDAEDQEDVTDMRELNIVPQNASSLDAIFEALSQCAALHPDKATLDDDDGLGDDAFIDSSNFETFTGDEDQELSEVGRAALAHLESIIYDPFDPAAQTNGTEEPAASDEEKVEPVGTGQQAKE